MRGGNNTVHTENFLKKPFSSSKTEIREAVRPSLSMIFAERGGENEFSTSSKLFWSKENDLLRMMDLQWPSVMGDGRSEERRDYREIRGQEIQFMRRGEPGKK